MPSKITYPQKIKPGSLKVFPKGGAVVFEYKDEKGRLIKKYAKKEIYKNYIEKNKRARKFEKNVLPILHKLVRDIRYSNDAKKVKAATILYTIYKTGLRIGSNADTKANIKAYGLSTLLNKHVCLDRSKHYIYLDFIGKKGVRNTALIKDPLVYKKFSEYKTGQWSEPVFNISSNYVRDYFNSIEGVKKNEFKIKDFRTLKANTIAKRIIDRRKGPAPTERKFKKWQLETADYVAKKLGNTRNVALNDYIDPELWNVWRRPEWGVFLPKKLKIKEDD